MISANKRDRRIQVGEKACEGFPGQLYGKSIYLNLQEFQLASKRGEMQCVSQNNLSPLSCQLLDQSHLSLFLGQQTKKPVKTCPSVGASLFADFPYHPTSIFWTRLKLHSSFFHYLGPLDHAFEQRTFFLGSGFFWYDSFHLLFVLHFMDWMNLVLNRNFSGSIVDWSQ